MRFTSLTYKKIRLAGLYILMALLSLPLSGQQAQNEKKTRQLFDVVLTIADENGTPVPDAKIVVGEGITHTATDANGSVSFKGYPEDLVTITAFQFEKKVATVIEIINAKTITLLKAKTQMTSDDVVPLPFDTYLKRGLTGSEVVIPGSYFAKYPSTDIRNALTGISSMYDIRELDGSPGLHPMEGYQNLNLLSTSTMGATDKFSNMPYVLVDNMPVDLQELVLDPFEIESATLVKGILATALYGPAATGGVIYIKTKKGQPNERSLHIDIENGVSITDRMPDFVNGVDYAKLNNEARVNDMLTPSYDAAALAGYANNDGYNLSYPNTDFSDMILDKQMEFRRVNLSSSGGNDKVQYFSYLGYAGEGDIINLGPVSDYNRITTRQNVNVAINDFFTAQFGFVGSLSFRRSPNYGFDPQYTSENTDNSTLTINEVPSILTDVNTISPVAFPIWAYYDTASNTPWYGVSALFNNNPIGNVVDQGYYTDRGRTGASHFALNFDAGKWIKGLTSTTYFGFNIHNTVRVGKTNDYLAYTVDPVTLALTRFTGHSLLKQADNLKLMDYYFQRYVFYEQLNYDRAFTNSTLKSSLTYNQVLSYINGVEEPTRQRNTVWSLLYTMKDKYSVHGVLNYAGNSSFAESYRNMLNWSVGGAWVISDESFLSSLDMVDFLKLRAQAGVVANETYFPNLYYVDRWTSTSTTSTTTPYGFGPLTSSPTWFGTTREDAVNRVYLSRTGNPILTFEKRREFNAGFDAVLFNNKINLDVTYYNWLVDGSLSQVSNVLPLLAGYNGARPYYNYNQTRYHYVGADLSFNQKIGEANLTVGLNATTGGGTRVKYDEPAYRFEYQTRTGKASDAIFGFEYLGKFTTDQEAQGGASGEVPIQMFDAKLSAGDLKYQDMNNDGVVDDQDQTQVGHSAPKLYYALNLTVKYKNFDFFIIGAGRAFYDIQLNNPYYWNGWGDNTYSAFVRDNIGGAYPKLTYYRINNNFQMSKFWLTKGDYFKIQNVELAYTIPSKMLQFMGGRAIRIYVRGANLLTFSSLKDLDPETIRTATVSGTSTNLAGGVNAYPLFRTISGGIKLNF